MSGGDATEEGARTAVGLWVRVAVFSFVCTAGGLVVGAVVVIDSVQGSAPAGTGVVAAVLAVLLAGLVTALEARRLALSSVRRAAIGVGVAVAVGFFGAAVTAGLVSAAAGADGRVAAGCDVVEGAPR